MYQISDFFIIIFQGSSPLFRVQNIPDRITQQIKDQHRHKDCKTRCENDPGRCLQGTAAFTHHGAPFGNRWFCTKPQERKTCQIHNHRTDIQSSRYHDGAKDIGEDMFKDHLIPAAAAQLCRAHIGIVFHSQHLASGNAGISRPCDQTDRNDRCPDTAADHTGNGNCKHHFRKRQKNIGNSHQYRIKPAANVSGNDTDHRPQYSDARHQ